MRWRNAKSSSFVAHPPACPCGRQAAHRYRGFPRRSGAVCPVPRNAACAYCAAVGELDEKNADILGHGEEELTEFSACAARFETRSSPLELGQPVTRRPMSLPKSLSISSLVESVSLDRVVQDSRDDRRIVELHVGENRRDLEGMRKKGVAGRTFCAPCAFMA